MIASFSTLNPLDKWTVWNDRSESGTCYKRTLLYLLGYWRNAAERGSFWHTSWSHWLGGRIMKGSIQSVGCVRVCASVSVVANGARDRGEATFALRISCCYKHQWGADPGWRFPDKMACLCLSQWVSMQVQGVGFLSLFSSNKFTRGFFNHYPSTMRRLGGRQSLVQEVSFFLLAHYV